MDASVVGVIAFVLVLVPLALLAIYMALGFWVGGRRFPSAGDFARSVEQSTGLVASIADPGWLSGTTLREVRFAGALESGRQAEVFYVAHRHHTGKSSSTSYTVHFCVAADPAVELDVTREGLFSRALSWIGWPQDVKVGDEEFDKRFFVKAPNEARTRRAMDQGLKGYTEQLFNGFAVERLEVKGSWLQVVIQERSLDPAYYPGLLRLLDLAAATFDRVPIVVRALGGERRAFRDAHGGTRCAYCHDAITGEESGLVACEHCHTVLHGDCWGELGRCPLLGCRGRAPERAGARP